jgi:hypothetical protein
MKPEHIDKLIDMVLLLLQAAFYLAAIVMVGRALMDVSAGWHGYQALIHAGVFTLLGMSISYFYLYLKALAGGGE